MALTTDAPQTRRGLVAGMFGGLAAAAATTLARPETALAETDPEAVHRNVNNPTSASTSVTCNGATSIRAISTGSGTNKSGVFAQANGTSSRGVTGVGVTGVIGQSSAGGGRGVTGLNLATSGDAYGVFGETSSPGGVGVRGEHGPNTGDGAGVSGAVSSPDGVGVEGFNTATSGAGVGVFGQTRSPIGRAVQGFHNSTSGVGAGVEGETASTQGVGVFGRADAATGGTGVLGSASKTSATGGSFNGTGGAVALRASGPVQFSTSGIATIPSGFGAVTVNPGVDITPTSKILCTLMSDPGATARLSHVIKNNAADTFQIFLNTNVTAACTVAYFVIS